MSAKFPPERRHMLIDPDRARVLDPGRIISLLPVEPGHVVMDVGCGNGFFTFPLAEYLVRGKVYAVDMQEGMLRDIRDRIAREDVKNVVPVLSQELTISLPEHSVDGVFSAFMLHETLDPPAFLRLMRGLMKPGGWLGLLEWYKREMESGPPVADRIDEQECLRLLQGAGFHLSSRPHLSDEHYIMVMANPAP